MALKKVLFTLLLFMGIAFAIQNITIPKNFTRSRYSMRRFSTTTTTALPTTILTNESSTTIELSTTTESPPSTTTAKTNGKNVTTKKSSISKSTTIKPKSTAITKTTISTTKTPTTITATTDEPQIKSYEHCGEQIGESFPWIAVIEHTKPRGKQRRKTLSKGVLIDEQHVLTTVSSLHNSLPFWIVSGVRLGDTPTWAAGDHLKRNKSMIVSIGIDTIYKHQYKDIAIIRLSEKVNFTDYISPVCLPDDDNYNFRELQLHICKRSSTKAITKLPIIRIVSVSPLSPQDCTIMFHRKHASFTLEEFCAWDESGDTCTGDLGGPLVGKLNGRYQVIGLNSYVNTRGDFAADDYPGIYTRVGSHLQWIKTILNDI